MFRIIKETFLSKLWMSIFFFFCIPCLERQKCAFHNSFSTSIQAYTTDRLAEPLLEMLLELPSCYSRIICSDQQSNVCCDTEISPTAPSHANRRHVTIINDRVVPLHIIFLHIITPHTKTNQKYKTIVRKTLFYRWSLSEIFLIFILLSQILIQPKYENLRILFCRCR